jgi:hypothetical protein
MFDNRIEVSIQRLQQAGTIAIGRGCDIRHE